MAAAVRYRIVPENPRAHRFFVETTVEKPDPDGQRFSLPVWIPGSYLVREFARHILDVTATSGGASVPVEKLDKNTWIARAPSGTFKAPLVVTAHVYAWDLSVRAAHLDTTHGFFNGTSVFFAFAGKESEPVDVVIEPPSDPACKGWRVATTLTSVDARDVGFGTYRAADYDELVDNPVEMGTFELVEWVSAGVPHAMAVTGRTRFDKDRLAKDCAAICTNQIEMMGGAPMKRYLFLTTALGDGYGGLEHKSCSALICKRDDLPKPGVTDASEGYKGFLGLVSHEYFHLWNVKRIKPASFAPYRLNEENYTRLLWAFEGITSYYDDLALVRSGVITVEAWLELMGKTLTRVLRSGGRKRQSVSESSFDSWIKFYRPDENTPNSGVSYYTKGAIIALALDLQVRKATAEKRSLDDVMRALWERHGKTGVGVPEDGVEKIASEIAGTDLSAFFDAAVRGTADLELRPLLEPYGIDVHLRAQESDADQGGKAGKKKKDDAPKRGSLGAVFGGGDDGAHLAHVHDGSAAQEAGLSAGDVVIAVDGLRVNRASLSRMVAERAPGTKLHVHAFRRDELFEATLTLQAPAEDTAWFALRDDASEEAKGRRAAFLGLD